MEQGTELSFRGMYLSEVWMDGDLAAPGSYPCKSYPSKTRTQGSCKWQAVKESPGGRIPRTPRYLDSLGTFLCRLL